VISRAAIEFIRETTVRRLVYQMNCAGTPVTRFAVYRWMRGDFEPRPIHARTVIRLSGGVLRFEDFYPGDGRERTRSG